MRSLTLGKDSLRHSRARTVRWSNSSECECGRTKLRLSRNQVPAETRLDLPPIDHENQAALRSYFANVEPSGSHWLILQGPRLSPFSGQANGPAAFLSGCSVLDFSRPFAGQTLRAGAPQLSDGSPETDGPSSAQPNAKTTIAGKHQPAARQGSREPPGKTTH